VDELQLALHPFHVSLERLLQVGHHAAQVVGGAPELLAGRAGVGLHTAPGREHRRLLTDPPREPPGPIEGGRAPPQRTDGGSGLGDPVEKSVHLGHVGAERAERLVEWRRRAGLRRRKKRRDPASHDVEQTQGLVEPLARQPAAALP
jgi:hypothetical protein